MANRKCIAIALSLFALCSNAFQIKESSNRDLQTRCSPLFSIENELEPLIIDPTHKALQPFHYIETSLDLIRKLRNKDQSYYHNLMDDLVMLSCDATQRMNDRCVLESSPFATKHSNNTCIDVSNSTCGDGMCETTSNCLWMKIQEGESRQTRFPLEEYEGVKERLYGHSSSSYAGEIVVVMAIGVGVAAIFLISWLIHFFIRYCCCCLWTSCGICRACSPLPNENGYSCCGQIFLPILLFFCCFVAILTSGAFALTGNDVIDVATTGCFEYANNLIVHLGEFLVRASLPLVALQGIIANAAQDALSIVSNTDYVRIMATKIVNGFATFISLYATGLGENQGQLSSLQDNFSSNIDPIVNNIEGMLDTLENDLYNGREVIDSALVSAVEQIQSFHNTSSSWTTNVSDVESMEESTRSMRLIGVMIAFIVGGTLSLAGIIAILVSRKNRNSRLIAMLDISSVFSSILGVICLVFASSLLGVSFVWLDLCETANIAVQDLEPLLGEIVARGTNTLFNGESLSEAYNLADRIDFQEKLDEGLLQIENTDVNQEFDNILEPLMDFQSVINQVQTKSLDALQNTTGREVPGVCAFSRTWQQDDLLAPWDPFSLSGWNVNSTGVPESMERFNNETPEEFMDRIYNVAGTCNANTSGGDCCLISDCTRNENESCNSGQNCDRNEICDVITETIVIAFQKWHEANRMTLTLGAEACPSGLECPAQEFKDAGYETTLVDLISSYGDSLKGTATSLSEIANSTVGEAMNEVERFLCSTNIAFLGQGYTEVKDEACTTILGAFAQICFAFFFLGMFLELSAFIGLVLAIRLRGFSKKEVGELYEAEYFKEGDEETEGQEYN